MLRMREAAGQLRLFCPSVNWLEFYCYREPWRGEPVFLEELFEEALDRHEFVPEWDDGEETGMYCAVCDTYLTIRSPG